MGQESRRPGRRQEQAEWRRERLLDAAMTVFGSKGIEAASMRDVAGAAGVTPGLLYHYFQSKEGLVLAIIAERGFLPELRTLLAEAGEQPAHVVLPRLISACADLLSQRAELIRLFVSGATGNPNIRRGLQAIVTEGQRLLIDYLTAGIDRGELRDHDAPAVAQMLFAPVILGQIVGLPADPSAVAAVLTDYLTPPGTAST